MIRLLAALYRRFLSLRYAVETHGVGCLKSGRPMLVLPNHIALVDPQIVFTEVSRFARLCPVVAEKYSALPILKTLFQMAGTVEVKDIDAGASSDELKAVFADIARTLSAGNSVLLYPSGQLAGQGKEAIFGKQGAYVAVRNLPDNTRVIGVRIRGLWGSMWSRAWLGKSPPFFRTYLKAVFFVLANLVFFVPKRDVSLEFEDITSAAKRNAAGDAQTFNTFLEEFYNRHGEERVRFVPHIGYLPPTGRELPEKIEGSIAEMQSVPTGNEADVDPETLEFLRKKIAEIKEISPESITPASHLILDLGFDSLGLAELVAIIKQRFHEASDIPLKTLKTVVDLGLLADGKLTANEILPECDFGRLPFFEPQPIKIDRDLSISRQIVKTCRRNPQTPFLFDTRFGTMTRKEFLRKATVIAHILKKTVPQDRVGIMLPAVSSSSLLIAACYLCGKIPVMLNWTVGGAALTHCADSAGVRFIVTAKSFYSAIGDQIPDDISKRLLFAEILIAHAGALTKAIGFAKSFLPAFCFPGKKNSEPAVILFTSGSEAVPKTVPLSAQNILADLWGTFRKLKVDTDEKILSFLPPFHSFGFTTTVILPLLTGIRTSYTPDPTDIRAILRMLAHTRSSVLLSTPTFLKMILGRATAPQLASLKLVISGAEACPEPLKARFRELTANRADFVEGYGITECAPVVSVTPRKKPKPGSVGVLIDGLFGLVADPETHKTIPAGESGMIFVRGPSIFGGYAGSEADPFAEINGDRWYKTGDLGFIDEEGYLFLTGRLSRFVKIGGEMVSLPRIEALLLEEFGEADETVLAVEGSDTDENPKIILFTVRDIPREQANGALRKRGASGLLSVDEVRKVESIPLLGSGKTDYRFLKAQI